MAELHVQWMDQEGPTDVLAFPMDELRPGRATSEPEPRAAGRRRAVPGRRRSSRRKTGRAHDRRRARPAHRPRDPAPPRLRPRRARGARGRCSACRRELLAEWLATSRRGAPTGGRQRVSGDSPGSSPGRGPGRRSPALLTAVEAALSAFSRARALELAARAAPRCACAAALVDDPRPHLNALLVLRLLLRDLRGRARHRDGRSTCSAPTWSRSLAAIGADVRRALRRRRRRPAHPRPAAHRVVSPWRRAAGRRRSAACSGRCPRLLILIGNALTPGKGSPRDRSPRRPSCASWSTWPRQPALIESGESKMIHSVFELGDTSCAR